VYNIVLYSRLRHQAQNKVRVKRKLYLNDFFFLNYTCSSSRAVNTRGRTNLRTRTNKTSINGKTNENVGSAFIESKTIAENI
jgi:hypothetical protein